MILRRDKGSPLTHDELDDNFEEIDGRLPPEDLVKFTEDGGLAVRLINRTGSPSVKGYCVTASSTYDSAVKLVPVNVPNCIGVFLESGIAEGALAWVVTEGMAKVYFSTVTYRGYLARTPLNTDGSAISGQALAEAIPTSPFADDKHFCEIGHILEEITAPGLALTKIHFN